MSIHHRQGEWATTRAGIPWVRSGALVLGWLTLLLLLGGCAREPKLIKAPDASELIRKQAVLAEHIASARKTLGSAAGHVAEAQKHQREADASHSKEVVLEGEIAPALELLRTKITDVQLRGEFDAVAKQFAELAALTPGTTAAIVSTGREIGDAHADITATVLSLDGAHTEARDINDKVGPEYRKAVESVVGAANASIVSEHTEAAKQATAKMIWFWISVGLAAAVVVLGFLYLKR